MSEESSTKEKEPSKAKQLAKKLYREKKHAALRKPEQLEPAWAFAEDYKWFIDRAKTERDAVSTGIELLEQAGYLPFDTEQSYEPGAKVYLNNRGRALIAATIGKKPVEQGVHFIISHIDSPRIDLKSTPLYEADGFAYLKSQYYGGILAYQWVTIPLALHGTVVTADGQSVNITLGENDDEPVFMISDLLPHLGHLEQEKKPLYEGIAGEQLNILIGSLPFSDVEPDEHVEEAIKLETLRLIHERYALTEEDFVRADISFVPASHARDLGFDGSLIAAYGQDDRICAYTSLRADIETIDPIYTTVTVFSDKEEVGSIGPTGMRSEFVFNFVADLADKQGGSTRKALAASYCLSADVGAGYDPSFPTPFEKNNTAHLNGGLLLEKYTGGRGKGGAVEASAEYMGKITRLLTEKGVIWQTGAIGAVDAGGGGTIAAFPASKSIETMDIGIPLLSMHAPLEISSKLDLYNGYLGFKAFYEAENF
jgi:aspartyl aminopeptidase